VTDMNELLVELKKLRDELELKMHLASLEMKQEWGELEQKMESFSSRAGLETTRDALGGALGVLGGEIKLGYQRFKAALKE
jgi:hypothetical protein